MIEEVGEIVVQTVLVEMEAAVGIAVAADGDGFERLIRLARDIGVWYHHLQSVREHLHDREAFTDVPQEHHRSTADNQGLQLQSRYRRREGDHVRHGNR